ncbi:hypothetical protein QN397_11415 [Variovorax sp. RTB1]|uniref:hypothetical protein n=1 Tax=Variovorax sp. RTB1 TaxID=3048631 RepID=UPI002B22E5BE|nr:hypothetical protein [Variovorax sp. RTB1]MEB0111960.1 hypothetical protein [Variovorax sp. RTB1]
MNASFNALQRCALATGLLVCAFLCGCASVTQGLEQSVKIETLTPAGAVLDGAECRLSNDKGSFVAMSGASTLVRRSGSNLLVNCLLVGQPSAQGQAVSRANAGMMGNVLIGGAIGAVIDAGTGAGYTYPAWMQLVFGEERRFDRGDNRTDAVTVGSVVGPAPNAVSVAVSAETVPSALPSVPSIAPAAQPIAAVVAASAPTTALRRGDALEYVLVDELTGRRSTVMYQVDRIDGGRVLFNQGSRIEKIDGEVISIFSATGGLFDTASPPGGWGRRDLKSGMRWQADFVSAVGEKGRHDLTAVAVGTGTARIDGRDLVVSRVEYEGWIYPGSAVVSLTTMQPAAFKSTVLYSAELGRVVRFDAVFNQRGAPVKESLQLIRVLQ